MGTIRVRVYDKARSSLIEVTVYPTSQPEGQSTLDGTPSSEGEIIFREVLTLTVSVTQINPTRGGKKRRKQKLIKILIRLN